MQSSFVVLGAFLSLTTAAVKAFETGAQGCGLTLPGNNDPTGTFTNFQKSFLPYTVLVSTQRGTNHTVITVVGVNGATFQGIYMEPTDSSAQWIAYDLANFHVNQPCQALTHSNTKAKNGAVFVLAPNQARKVNMIIAMFKNVYWRYDAIML